MQYALPYTESTLPRLLTISSFILLLNLVPTLLSKRYLKLSSLTLIFQIVLGTVFGPPLFSILPSTTCDAVHDLGYIGLILLCYEGGLNTSVPQLLSDFFLSAAVAVTGISVPILLSFLLEFEHFGDASWTQAFACGAALSATSLGTTFTLLSGAGLSRTRLGVVLTSAAMMDDVVGLVMIRIVPSLGSHSSEGGEVGMAETLSRPIGASVGLLLFMFAACWVAGKCRKSTILNNEFLRRKITETKRRHAALVRHTGLLIAFVVVAYYAGTSVLFAAFMAGAAISWWDETAPNADQEGSGDVRSAPSTKATDGKEIYENFYAPCVKRMFEPFFFASIGFAIPVRRMFYASTVWRGLAYSVLMTLAKAATGIWLVPFPKLRNPFRKQRQQRPAPSPNREKASSARKFYPPALLGMSMVARGEIAFLIASVADAGGIFKGRDELFLIVVWAAVVCTIVGPLVVGLLLRRVKTESVDDVLGRWGTRRGGELHV